MKWKKYTIDTTTEASDLVCEVLRDNDIESMEIQDNVPLTDEELQGMFVDIMPDTPEDDGTAKVHFYMDGDMSPEAAAMKIADIREGLNVMAQFVEAGPLTITEGETDEADWRDNWKQYFHTFTIDDVTIRPSWEEPEGPDTGLTILMDPGAAFGTGSHETTRLCIRALRKYVQPGDRVLDVGTGSGILSIAALMSGASYALGTDLDALAVTAARENADRNGIAPETFDIIQGNIIDDEAVQKRAGDDYDICVANILAPIIILLQAETPRHVKPGGLMICSGILDEKEQDVRDAFEANPEWQIEAVEHDNEWVCVVARKRAALD